MSSLTTKEKCNTVDRINEAYMASHYEDKALVSISKTKSDEKVEEMSPELFFFNEKIAAGVERRASYAEH